MSHYFFHTEAPLFQRVKDPYDIANVAQCTLQFDEDAIWQLSEMGFQVPESLSKAVVKRQSEFLAGRYCAQTAMLALGEPGVAKGQLGEKNRLPDWPPSIIGSISHSHGLARAAVARAEDFWGIGIDSEKLVSSEKAIKLKDQIFRASEAVVTAKLELEIAFSLVFSAKESIFKAINPLTGEFFGYHDASILEIGSDYFVFRLERDLNQIFHSGYSHRGHFKIHYPFVHTSVCLHKGQHGID